MPHTPAVSIVIRAYRRRWLRDAIASVLAQTYRDIELVVYDDAGDLEPLVDAFDDARIRYRRGARGLGASGRFQAAVAACRGPILGVLDDDDRYEPEFVARLADVLERDPDVGIAFSRTTWETEDGTRHVPFDPREAGRVVDAAVEMLRCSWTVTPSLMLARADALDAAGLASMPDGIAPDQYLNVGVSRAGWAHVLVDAHLVVSRWHQTQVSRTFPVADDMAVATWRAILARDPQLSDLVHTRLARSLIVRALFRLRDGYASDARRDLVEAGMCCPGDHRWPRRVLLAASGVPPVGRLAATAYIAMAPHGRCQRRPPARVSASDPAGR